MAIIIFIQHTCAVMRPSIICAFLSYIKIVVGPVTAESLMSLAYLYITYIINSSIATDTLYGQRSRVEPGNEAKSSGYCSPCMLDIASSPGPPYNGGESFLT